MNPRPATDTSSLLQVYLVLMFQMKASEPEAYFHPSPVCFLSPRPDPGFEEPWFLTSSQILKAAYLEPVATAYAAAN